MNQGFIIKVKEVVKSNYKMAIGVVALFLISLYIISVYYNAVKYSINTLDDFIHYCSYEKLYLDRNFSVFDFAIKYVKWHLVNHGGLYFSMFLQILLGPNPYIDIIAKNGIVMVWNMLFYFVSLYILIFTIVCKVIIRKTCILNKIFLSLIIFLTMVILHNSYQFYTEIFTWFSGATSYSIPLSLLFISIALFILLIETNRKFKYFLVLPIIITSICALGGSISVVCIAFIMVLSLFIYTIINKKLSIVSIGLYFNYLCFALLNVNAPGNYHRLSRTLDSTISYTNQLFDPERITLVLNVANEFLTERQECLFSKLNFILILLIVTVVIGFWISKNIDIAIYRKILLTILPFAVMPYLVCLSFSVGYQDKIDMFDRCYFIIDFSIIFTLLIFLIYAFMLLYSILLYKRILLCEFGIVIIIVLNTLTSVNCKIDNNEYKDINRIELITVAIDNSENKYKKYNEKCAERIDALRASEGRELAQIRYLSYDEAPKYMMKFYDGKHMPWILPDESYLPCFYDISEITILENIE